MLSEAFGQENRRTGLYPERRNQISRWRYRIARRMAFNNAAIAIKNHEVDDGNADPNQFPM